VNDRPRFRHILVGSAWLGLGEGFTRLANFLIVVIVAHSRGPEGLGVFAIGQLIGNYLLIGTDFGFKTAGSRLVSLHPSWARALVHTIQRQRARLSVILFPVGLWYAYMGPVPDEARLFVVGFSLSVLPQALTLDWMLLGLERYALLSMLRAGVALLFAAASAAVLLTDSGLELVAVSNGLATFIGAIAVWVLWFRRSEHGMSPSLAAGEAAQLRRETRWRAIAWLGLATIFVQMFQTIDTLMLGGPSGLRFLLSLYAGHAAEIGADDRRCLGSGSAMGRLDCRSWNDGRCVDIPLGRRTHGNRLRTLDGGCRSRSPMAIMDNPR